MLRIVVVVLGVLLLLGGAISMLVPGHGGFPFLLIGGLIVVSVLFEGHYRSKTAAPTASLQSTGEKFIDPGTGKLVEVDYDPETGERVYR